MIEKHIIPEGIPGLRLDNYVVESFALFPTRKSAYKAIKRGEILINGKACDPNYRVASGELLEINDSRSSMPRPYKMVLKIVYEDDYLAVIEKPAGITVNGNRFRAIENALMYNLKPSGKDDALKWPRPVHRLDSATGGLLVCAKTRKAHYLLCSQFQLRSVHKRYTAVVTGRLKGEGKIDLPLDDREAITRYRAIKNVRSLKNEWLTLVELLPETGRTHQLRRHLTSIGYPILGDKMYGNRGKILKGKGLFLFASEIAFVHPESNDMILLKLDLPNKFSTLLQREERRWVERQ